jgi:N-acetylmuramoyl-L-alanine amidase CwlA
MRQTIQKFIEKNRPKTPLQAKGVVLHETANPGATALNHWQYFNYMTRNASAHAFIDWAETIQTIPWNERAWHAGKTANSKYIGIEMCRPRKHSEDEFNIVYNEAVLLFSRLLYIVLKIDTVTIDNVLSHDECRKRFKDTTHNDPTALFKEYGKTINRFREDVQNAINKLKG